MLKPGDKAPDFTLPDQHGNPFTLSESLKAKVWHICYFYPADDTPGCTAEACSFRDSHEEFTDAGAVVVGISGDSTESHAKFAAKHNLPFTLVSDRDGAVREAFGVKKTMGLLPGRVTFVIDPAGTVRSSFSSQLRPKRHIDEALGAIRAGATRPD